MERNKKRGERRDKPMGQISLFLGVAVYMYTEPGSPHKLPHVHVVAGGEKAKSEVAGYHDMAIFKQGVTL